MVVRSVRHQGLRRLLQDDTPRFLPSELAGRIRRILTVLLLAEDMDDFIASAPSGWRVHRLSGTGGANGACQSQATGESRSRT